MPVIGVISDTHGKLRPEAVQALKGCELIIHGGDIGAPDVIEQLEEIAPVRAIRGNVDRGDWAEAYPETRTVEIADRRIYVLHDLKALTEDPASEGYAAVIAGHSHQPRVERRNGVLFLNPGSAGPRRFKLPVTLARLTVTPRRLAPRLITLI